MPRTIPAADAKIGKKLDYIAAELGDALKSHGFTRKARQLWRETGAGERRCFHVLDLQGDKWNEGNQGKFCINIGVQFPRLTTLFSELSDQVFRAAMANDPDPALCVPSGRLGDALPATREAWWTPEMDAGKDIWLHIRADTDLAALAEIIRRSALEYLLPWFDRNSSFEHIFHDPGIGAQNHCYGLICGVLLGRKDEVRTRFLEKGSKCLSAKWFADTKAWLERNGVDCADVDFTPTPPSAQSANRVAVFEAARASAEAAERALTQDGTLPSSRLPQLLLAFHEACRTRDGEHAASPIWSLLQRADVETRRLAVITIMQKLVGAATNVPSLHPNIWGEYASYDGYWGELLGMLLKGLPCDEAFAGALFANLPPLTRRVTRPGLICLELTGAFRHVVHYLYREARPWSATFKSQVEQLLVSIRDVSLADFDELAKAEVPGLRTADLGRHLPLLNNKALRDRQVDYPEQRFEKPDRDAVAALRKWLNRDADGRDVLVIENDDWGRQLSAALQTFPGDKAALMKIIEGFADAPPAKVSPAFIKQANAFIPTITGQSGAEKAVDWLDALLRSYAHSDLRYEWATSTTRPGIGAFAGEMSGNILLGLIRLAHVWQPERFAQALAIVAEAGLTVIPEIRARNQKAATAAVEALAASARGKELLLAYRKRVKKPSVQKLLDNALGKASPN